MDERQTKRFTGRELHALFDELLPHGFAGADVLAEIAPEEWGHSPLLACLHPVCGEALRGTSEDPPQPGSVASTPKPARGHGGTRSATGTYGRGRAPRVRTVACEGTEVITELRDLCLWDIFSDNHDVIAGG
jgi:hypothetical protein